jgi:hypothetical protein
MNAPTAICHDGTPNAPNAYEANASEMPGTKRWPTTAHKPPPLDLRVEAVGPRPPEQRSCAPPTRPPADEAGDDRGTNGGAHGDERAKYGSEQDATAGGQDRAGDEYRAESGRHHDVGQRSKRTRRSHDAPDVFDVDHSRHGEQIEQSAQECGEQGKSRDVAPPGRRGRIVALGHADAILPCIDSVAKFQSTPRRQLAQSTEARNG